MPAYHPQRIEPKWQSRWEQAKTFRAIDLDPSRPKLYILDMFPYPSAAGLHVGHPKGYTATDIVARYKRMCGFNVLHPMGWDAFGLPAEQYAVQTNTHPRITTATNIDTFRRQIKSLGFSYDWDREVDTTDPEYYKWTQWIFLQIHDTWYDPDFEWTDATGCKHKGKGRPIALLPIPRGTSDPDAYRDARRLAYRAEVPVNWCPALGTVLANEEVIDGKSERGGHPVLRMPLEQWMLRITAYAERLVEDLELVDWPRAIKDMQRNWVGRSEGAEVDFPIVGLGEPESRPGAGAEPSVDWLCALRRWTEAPGKDVIRVFTTRPDTLFGATYMVLAPEHPLVDRITTAPHRPLVEEYRRATAAKSELERTNLAKSKTGVFTGAFAINPVNGKKIPIWIADYVLLGYGTGAIMAVPGHDERDFEFAQAFDLPIVRVVAASLDQSHAPLSHAEVEPGISVNSHNAGITLDGLPTSEAKAAITRWLELHGLGKHMVNYKLRDWLFSRQRYWGEPFPVVLDGQDRAHAVPISELPVRLPELDDYMPTGKPEPPLNKAVDWVRYSDQARRETNTMPQWAGSCWYFLRYIDPHNDKLPWAAEKERYWMPVDLYIGGAEHAVLHLLYSRFWYKVLYDRGLVSTSEPFLKLVNQGMILGEPEYTGYHDTARRWIAPQSASGTEGVVAVKLSEDEVVKTAAGFFLAADPSVAVEARAHKMSKARGNVINPDEIVAEYGADSLRLYEMFMGPLEAVNPWSTKGVEGVYRFLARAWRMIVDEKADPERLDARVKSVELSREQARVVAQTVAAVTDDIERLRFNTAISRLMEFVNFFTAHDVRPKAAMETFALLLSPMAPHLGEELWQVLGHEESLAYEPWPAYDPALLKEEQVEIPIQVNGKLRGRVLVPADADGVLIERCARTDPKIAVLLEGKTIRKVVVVPGKLVNFVV